LFGGELSPINSSNIIFRYDIAKESWQKISPNIDVPKVDSHAAVVFEGKMLVYGGYVPDKATYMTDIYAFDFEKQSWEVYYKGGKDC
jgi:N-acetylneuraminic acid mutarotase